MNDLTVRKLEMSIRVAGFLSSNSILFRKGSQGPQLVKEFKRSVEEVRTLIGAQMSDAAQAHAKSCVRSTARKALIEAMGRVNRCAQGMTLADPGLNEKFPMPWGAGDSTILARARSFAENASPLVKSFIAFEMAPDFLEDLKTRISAFEQAFDEHNASKTALVATSRQIADAMQRTMTVLGQLTPIIENKLAGDGDFAGIQKWRNVRRIERAWVSRKPVVVKPDDNPPAAAA